MRAPFTLRAVEPGAAADQYGSSAEGSSDSPIIVTQLTTGIAKPRPRTGARPASAARRTDMLTPIQKNGRVTAPSARTSPVSRTCRPLVRTLYTGKNTAMVATRNR